MQTLGFTVATVGDISSVADAIRLHPRTGPGRPSIFRHRLHYYRSVNWSKDAARGDMREDGRAPRRRRGEG